MLLKYNINISFIQGVIVIGLFAAGSILVLGNYLPDTDQFDTLAVVALPRQKVSIATPCIAGQKCQGLTVRAEDPEGEDVVYTFYDSHTKQPIVEPIIAKSGEEVTPIFTFTEAGKKNLYMVVQDGSGHVAPNYPIIVPVDSPTTK